MFGNGKGKFKTVHPTKAGLKMYQDLRDLKLLQTATGYKLLGAVNSGPMQFYSLK
jgi:hypothetical protein